MRIVFLGPPGAGKGTQSQRLGQYLEVPHISTGEALREASRNGTELGKKAAKFYEVGKLVPNEFVVEIVAERLLQPDCRSGCLFDGFPRTVPQAEALDRLLAEQGDKVNVVLQLQIDNEELINRLASRGRVDDEVETIKERLQQYAAWTNPVVDFYQQRGVLCQIPGLGTPDEVFARIKTVVDATPTK